MYRECEILCVFTLLVEVFNSNFCHVWIVVEFLCQRTPQKHVHGRLMNKGGGAGIDTLFQKRDVIQASLEGCGA